MPDLKYLNYFDKKIAFKNLICFHLVNFLFFSLFSFFLPLFALSMIWICCLNG